MVIIGLETRPVKARPPTVVDMSGATAIPLPTTVMSYSSSALTMLKR